MAFSQEIIDRINKSRRGKRDKIIPLGSVVQLNDESFYMIMGYMHTDVDTKKRYDYVGCPYPEGISKEIKLFNEKDIKTKRFVGFLNEPILQINKKMAELKREIENKS